MGVVLNPLQNNKGHQAFKTWPHSTFPISLFISSGTWCSNPNEILPVLKHITDENSKPLFSLLLLDSSNSTRRLLILTTFFLSELFHPQFYTEENLGLKKKKLWLKVTKPWSNVTERNPGLLEFHQKPNFSPSAGCTWRGHQSTTLPRNYSQTRWVGRFPTPKYNGPRPNLRCGEFTRIQ